MEAAPGKGLGGAAEAVPGKGLARGKLLQYEQVLALYEYGDVLGKTKRLSLSHIQKLPGELEQLTKGELADLVKGLVKSLEEGGDG